MLKIYQMILLEILKNKISPQAKLHENSLIYAEVILDDYLSTLYG